MSKTFRQNDSRWGNKPYPSKPYTMTGSGCGPTACADIIVNNPEFKKLTPNDTRKYMIKKGYAIRGKGTLWAGIPKTLRHYGFVAGEHGTMAVFFKEMEKTGRYGVLLFDAGTRGGVTWTTCGHFVAVTNYKEKKGKHYLYTRDPNGYRANDGWHCYETTMKGLIIGCWTCYLPNTGKKEPEHTSVHVAAFYAGEFPKLPKRGYFQKYDHGEEVRKMQKFLIWAGFSCGEAGADGVYGPATFDAVEKFQKANGVPVDGKFGPMSLAMAKTIRK